MSEHKTRSDRDPALALIRTAMVEKSSPRPSSPTRPIATRRRSRTCSAAARCATRRCSTSAWCWGWTTRASRRRGRAAWRPRSRWTSRARAASSPRSTWAPIRAAVDHYIGSYLTLRPAFSAPDRMVAYRTDIVWDPEWPSLLFEERDRPDASFAHRGRLYLPASSPFLHLVSLTKGAMRMVLVSQIDQAGEHARLDDDPQQAAGDVSAGGRAPSSTRGARRLRSAGWARSRRATPPMQATRRCCARRSSSATRASAPQGLGQSR